MNKKTYPKDPTGKFLMVPADELGLLAEEIRMLKNIIIDLEEQLFDLQAKKASMVSTGGKDAE